MSRRLRRFLGALCLLPAIATMTQATTLARMNLEELARAAHAIAQVRCLENESRWEEGEIWTFTRFEVLEAMKGAVPRLISLRLLGGRVGHLVSTVDSVPRFHPGEETILFLERMSTNDFSVTSWAQGTFRIARDAQTGQQSVTQDSSAMPVFDPAARRFRTAGVRHLPLSVFKRRLAAILEQQMNRREP